MPGGTQLRGGVLDVLDALATLGRGAVDRVPNIPIPLGGVGGSSGGVAMVGLQDILRWVVPQNPEGVALSGVFPFKAFAGTGDDLMAAIINKVGPSVRRGINEDSLVKRLFPKAVNWKGKIHTLDKPQPWQHHRDIAQAHGISPSAIEREMDLTAKELAEVPIADRTRGVLLPDESFVPQEFFDEWFTRALYGKPP